MSYSLYEDALSSPRIGRYKHAILYYNSETGDSESLALNLYNLNINLATSFYPILNNFEVLFRNNVNLFLSNHFQSHNWIIEQCSEDGYFSLPIFETSEYKVREDIKENYAKLTETGYYTPDKLVAKVSFGFWVHKFSAKEFVATNHTLHKSFTHRPKNTKHKDIFKGLYKILEFRNRIAHYEPIIFDKEKIISTEKSKQIIDLIKTFSSWINSDYLILFEEHISTLQSKIEDVDAFILKISDKIT